MNAFERIEPRLPKLLDELAPTRVPPYLDELLLKTAGTRQRPAWSAMPGWTSALDGWADRLPQVPWRLAIVVALLVLVAAALVFSAGSRQSLPPPFGPARNGALLWSTSTGDIEAVDLQTGLVRPVLAGPAKDEAPAFAPDGRSFLFSRNSGQPAVDIAASDGSGAHSIIADTSGLRRFAWSQDGSTVLATASRVDGVPLILVVDPRSGATRTLQPGRLFNEVTEPYGTQTLVLADSTGGHGRYWALALSDQQRPRQLPASPDASDTFTLSPDGTRLVYATWPANAPTRTQEIHVLDLRTGEDRVASPAGPGFVVWQSPQFMPDGRSILVNRWSEGRLQVTLLPAGGGGPLRPLGPVRTEQCCGADDWISPDGMTILVSYRDDGRRDSVLWVLDVATGAQRTLPWTEPTLFSWQRAGW